MLIKYVLVFFFFLSYACIAQTIADNQRERFGVFTHFTINIHSADFQQLPNIDNCCQRFESGSGNQFSIGGLYEFPVSNRFGLSLRASYTDMSGELQTKENKPVFDIAANRLVQQATILHTINASLASIGFEPLVSYNPVRGMRLFTGMRIAYLNKISFIQNETIEQPGFVFVENNQKVRNERQGDLANIANIQNSLMFGASMEFPLNKVRTLLLSPELFYSLGLQNLTTDLSWKYNSLRFGIALKFATPPMDTRIIAPPADSTTQPKPLPIVTQSPQTPKINPEYSIQTYSSINKETPTDTIIYDTYFSREIKPLLHYIFFDKNSSEIASRYTLLTRENTKKFTLENLSRLNILDTYYSLLNIVGKRLKDFPKAKITLVGCVSDNNGEKGNVSLAKNRALSIQKYLTETWGIDSKRVTVESRLLPMNYSRTNDANKAASDEENRRVEILSDIPEITAPFIANDTVYETSPPIVYAIIHNPLMKGYTLQICGDNTLNPDNCVRYERYNSADTIAWKATDDYHLIEKNKAITFAINNDDMSQKVYKKIIVQQKKQTMSSRKTVETYRLILFDFDKSDLSDNHRRIADVIQENITSTTNVSIEGSTDFLGDAAYNRRLSLERASATARYIGVPQQFVEGKGEQEYSTNSLPEGRFYNRTVTVKLVNIVP